MYWVYVPLNKFHSTKNTAGNLSWPDKILRYESGLILRQQEIYLGLGFQVNMDREGRKA